MPKHRVTIEFLEPFRLLPPEVEHGQEGDGRRRRMAGYARWYEIGDGRGRPVLTGTLLRSAVLRAAEALLAMRNGVWDSFPCCAGEFTKRKKGKYLRARSTPSWNAGAPCGENDPCLFCLLLGRFKKGKTTVSPDGFQIHFSNLTPADGASFENIEGAGARRTINRVDQFDGKAFDFVSIWEIDQVARLTGTITMADGIPPEKRGALLSLVKASLALVDILAGGACMVSLEAGAPEDPKASGMASRATSQRDMPPPPDFIGYAQNLAGAFENKEKANRLRVLADAIRGLRKKSEADNDLGLPREMADRDGGLRGHHLWDKIRVAGPMGEVSLRNYLEGMIDQARNYGWRHFWEEFGQAVYDVAKATDPAIEIPRPIGSSEAVQTAPPPGTVRRSAGAPFTHKTVLTGRLRALSPLHIGTATEPGSQTSMKVLLTRDGRFRIPHSALRGILRRDLGLVSGGRDCAMELGRATPCRCVACRIRRRIAIQDSVSGMSLPPDIRQRIRMEPVTGTVAEGALFDLEVAPEGLEFPFILRYRGGPSLPNELATVLRWWMDGNLFIGGAGGTGKGRFKLVDLKCKTWDLTQNFELADYQQKSVLWGEECSLESDDFQQPQAVLPFAWEEVPWKIIFDGTVLTNDPIEALISGGGDAVFSKKTVLETVNGKMESMERLVIKGETMRGVIRAAFGRITGTLTKDHDDCACPQCLVFGSEHRTGLLRFEDLTPADDAGMEEIRVDRTAIARNTGGVAGGLKFDAKPLVGERCTFKGSIWLHRDLVEGKAADGGGDKDPLSNARRLFADAMADFHDGLAPVGANSGIGYGWVTGVKLDGGPDWLQPPLSCKDPEIGDNEEAAAEQAPRGPGSGPVLSPRARYYPHYFLPLHGTAPARETEVISHDFYGQGLLTGKLVCRLETLTPLVIPDTTSTNTLGLENLPDGHRADRFLRIGEKPVIRGSQIRGPVSSVFEALTNSCLRVLDEGFHLTRRMAADTRNIRPGRLVRGKDGKLCVQPCRSAAVRFYAGLDEKTRKSLSDGELHGLVETSAWVRKFEARIGAVSPGIGWKKEMGWLKITGPNKVEVENKSNPGVSSFPADWKEVFITRDGSDPGKGHRRFICSDECQSFTVDKWREAFFYPSGQDLLPLDPSAEQIYSTLMDSYKDNPQAPPEVFRSLPVKRWESEREPKLREGGLVYYRNPGNGRPVLEIFPVRISRMADIKPLGKRLPEALKPCAHICLEGCDPCVGKACPFFGLYRPGRPVKGLCPACHLFGTAGYRNRVRFGTARLRGEPIWAKSGDKPAFRGITLPLLEKPRPTYAMPQSDSPIPGRKFYVHHAGWKKVIRDTVERNDNNETVEALGEGNRFDFEVRFENLRPWELGLLIFSLELENSLAHKIGKAKAFGFGSAAIRIGDVHLREKPGLWRKVDPDERSGFLSEGKQKLQEWFGVGDWSSATHVVNLRRLLRFQNDEDIIVGYPHLEGDGGEPGYIQLKKAGFRPAEVLVKPWEPWLPGTSGAKT